jgi:catechol 2,3-dioxygenase-like lactoylglutathione lyase family enzyme
MRCAASRPKQLFREPSPAAARDSRSHAEGAASRPRSYVASVASSGIDHVVIGVGNWERSNRFYSDVVGAELVALPRGRYAYRVGQAQLNVHGPGAAPSPLPAKPVTRGNSDLCLRWDGPIEKAVEHLRAHRVEIIDRPARRQGSAGEGLSVYFNDPDGSLLEFISYEAEPTR